MEPTKPFFPCTDKRYAKPTIEDDGFAIDQQSWERLLIALNEHQNLLITGPTSSGKTELVNLVCKRLELPLHTHYVATMVEDPISALFGRYRIEGGNFVYETASFLKEVQEPGVIFFDDINRAPANVHNCLMPCLDESRQICNYNATPTQIIDINPECTFIATACIGAEYIGTYKLDARLSSLFAARLKLDYLSVGDEAAILVKRTGIEMADAKTIATIADSIRTKYKKGEISTNMTIRQTLCAAELITQLDYPLLEALEGTCLLHYNKVERSIVEKIIEQSMQADEE